MNRPALMAISFGYLLISASDFTQAGEAQHFHTHGVANLTLASENGAVEVQFESPAMSLLGFEHTPRTKQQIEIVERTKSFLTKPENVLSINGADCSFSGSSVNILGPAGKALKDNETAKREHDHDHQDSDDQHFENEPTQEGHSEVSANYLLDCVDEKTPQSIKVLLFRRFPSLEKIEVNWVTETQQGESILRSQASTIELR